MSFLFYPLKFHTAISVGCFYAAAAAAVSAATTTSTTTTLKLKNGIKKITFHRNKRARHTQAHFVLCCVVLSVTEYKAHHS